MYHQWIYSVYSVHCIRMYYQLLTNWCIQFALLTTSECISVFSVEPWSAFSTYSICTACYVHENVVAVVSAEQWLARVGSHWPWWDKATSLLSSMQECLVERCKNVVRERCKANPETQVFYNHHPVSMQVYAAMQGQPWDERNLLSLQK